MATRPTLREIADQHIPNDPPDCPTCGILADERICWSCGIFARILDCGHMPQPRPLAPGRADGTELARTFCPLCARLPREAADDA